MPVIGQPRQLKDAVYEQIARIGKSVASGPRLEILDLLGQSPRTVEALSKEVNQSVANTSRHLQVLKTARLVESEKEGVHVRYRLADENVSTFFVMMRRLAEARLLEIEKITQDYFDAREQMESVGREDLFERVRSGNVTILDVRPTSEYAAGHIPGALSVPVDVLEEKLAELPKDREIVAYCRGPYCVMALEAVAMLQAHGYIAHRLDEGIPAWRAQGLDVEKSGTEENQ